MEIDYSLEALDVFDFSGLLLICIFLFVLACWLYLLNLRPHIYLIVKCLQFQKLFSFL
jgi:hypothetical protein